MYYFLALCMVLGYALQTILIVRYFRSLDPFFAAAYRCASLALTMSPLLLFVPSENYSLIQPYSANILFAILFSSAGNVLTAITYRRFPVGISGALMSGTSACGLVLFSLFLFQEQVSDLTLGTVLGIITLSITLAFSKSKITTVDSGRASVGYIFSVLAGLMRASGFAQMILFARNVDPLLAAYLWEAGIGVVLLMLVVVRGFLFADHPKLLPFSTFRRIMLAASPTLIGTGCYALASRIGPVSVLAAFHVSGIVVTAVFARFVYHEQLSTKQWTLLLMVVGLLLFLKVSS